MTDVKRHGLFDLLQLTMLGDERFVYASDYDALVADRDRLAAAEADFHMAYRMRCDVETKVLHVEVERLQAELSAARADADALVTAWDGYNRGEPLGSSHAWRWSRVETAIDRLRAALSAGDGQ